MTLFVFGHQSPDTDTMGSAIIWAWYLSNIENIQAEARLLGTPNKEALFVLDRWNIALPEIIDDVERAQPVAIVDTNNVDELPANIAHADIRAIIDHHKLTGGLETIEPISITIRPLACTATILYELMGTNQNKMPDKIKAVMLSCILSDTLAFRSPTTTPTDENLARKLAKELNLDIVRYSDEMFAAKSDLSEYSDNELLRIDSKTYTIGDTKLRISVLETTTTKEILARKAGLIAAMDNVAQEDKVDQILLFIVDILAQESILLVPNALCKNIAQKSFNVTAQDDIVHLPNIVSRKKQIIPALTL